MIQLVKDSNKAENLVFVLGKENNHVEVPVLLQEFVKVFVDSKKEEGFSKIGEQYFFFVKENSDLEKMRLAGFNIRKQLDTKATTLNVIGEGKATLALVEGFELSNYQFLKYFKDGEEKKYALNTIGVQGNFTEKEVADLNNTIKAVYWARTMVNEPVNFLNATQLAREIEALGKEADFSVKVLEKKQIEEMKMGGLLAVNRGSEIGRAHV